jgi:hypothetical protein
MSARAELVNLSAPRNVSVLHAYTADWYAPALVVRRGFADARPKRKQKIARPLSPLAKENGGEFRC